VASPGALPVGLPAVPVGGRARACSRRWLVAAGRNGLIEANAETPRGSRPAMATCFPRVGIRLASLRYARLRRRNIE
jgi:hypothetical protein